MMIESKYRIHTCIFSYFVLFLSSTCHLYEDCDIFRSYARKQKFYSKSFYWISSAMNIIRINECFINNKHCIDYSIYESWHSKRIELWGNNNHNWMRSAIVLYFFWLLYVVSMVYGVWHTMPVLVRLWTLMTTKTYQSQSHSVEQKEKSLHHEALKWVTQSKW